MTAVPADWTEWHSTNPLLDDCVYHICHNCTEGNNIEKRYLKEGRPASLLSALCKRCERLVAAGRCDRDPPFRIAAALRSAVGSVVPADWTEWHSTNPFLDDHVYHICRNCTEGNNIEKRHLKEGRPVGLLSALCKHCERLGAAGRCRFVSPAFSRS